MENNLLIMGASDRMINFITNKGKEFNQEQLEVILEGIKKGLSDEQILGFSKPHNSVNKMKRIIIQEVTKLKFLKPLLVKHHMTDFSKAYDVKELLQQRDRYVRTAHHIDDNNLNEEEFVKLLIDEYNKYYMYIDALLFTYDESPFVAMDDTFVCGYRGKDNKVCNTITVRIRTKEGTKPSDIVWEDLNFLIQVMINNSEETRKYAKKLLKLDLNKSGTEIQAIFKINK